jgi:PAS domain S-box-containing protein
MEYSDTNKMLKRYTRRSILAGVVFIFLAYIFGFIHLDLSFSLRGIIKLHKNIPIIWFVDFAPIAMIFSIYFLTRKANNKITHAEQIARGERLKSKKVLSFIKKLIEGDLDESYELSDVHDILGKSLVSLRDNLKENQEIEFKRRKEDDQRSWLAEGLAKFGEILRKDNSNIEELTYNIISNLVKYIDANQGATFIINEDEKFQKSFDMTACFAYDRRKYADRKIAFGEGLVGTCALERHTIYLTDIPDNYLSITSGLGHSCPKSLLIVPLIINDEIHGVIELASFNQLEKYQINFVEKIAESIASTISNVKINVRTSKLLKASQEQAETLASQEEHLRQNMEELQATQEEAARQNEKFISFTNSVNQTLIRAEFAIDGTLLSVNNKFLDKLGYTSNSEIEGKNVKIFIHDKDIENFSKIWDKLSAGGKHFEGEMKLITRQGQDLWINTTFTCIRREDRSVEKILFLAMDITISKKIALDYEGQVQALNQSSIKAEFAPEGELLDANTEFLNILNYSYEEIADKTVFDFVNVTALKSFKDGWTSLQSKEYFNGIFQFTAKNGENVWLKISCSALKDLYNEVSKVILLASDSTKEKTLEIETQKQKEIIEIQNEKLKAANEELTFKIEKSRKELIQQYKDIERTKIRDEKILEGMLYSVVTINQNGIVELFNRAAESLWCIRKKEILGKNVRTLFSEESLAKDEFVQRLAQPGESKITDQRKKIKILTLEGEEKEVFCFISESKLDNESTFTVILQNGEAEK